jgi:hypothetical protein
MDYQRALQCTLRVSNNFRKLIQCKYSASGSGKLNLGRGLEPPAAIPDNYLWQITQKVSLPQRRARYSAKMQVLPQEEQ